MYAHLFSDLASHQMYPDVTVHRHVPAPFPVLAQIRI